MTFHFNDEAFLGFFFSVSFVLILSGSTLKAFRTRHRLRGVPYVHVLSIRMPSHDLSDDLIQGVSPIPIVGYPSYPSTYNSSLLEVYSCVRKNADPLGSSGAYIEPGA